MRFPVISVIFVLMYCAQCAVSSEKLYPFGDATIPVKTNEPININTTEVKCINVGPTKIVLGVFEKAVLVNNGKTVEGIVTSPFTSSIAFGGILKGTYIGSREKFYFNRLDCKEGVYGSTVDGKGETPLMVCLYFYKKDYGSFENALWYRDGIFKLCSRILVEGFVPNPLFEAISPFLKQIRKPGKVEIPLTFAVAFYDVFPPDVEYFVYPGEYIDENTGKKYYSTITLIKPILPYRFISIPQFMETFGCMEDSWGKPLNTAEKQVPSEECIPIVKARGLIQYCSPVPLFPSKPGGV